MATGVDNRDVGIMRMFRPTLLATPVHVSPRYTERLILRQYREDDLFDLIDLHESAMIRDGLGWPARTPHESRAHLNARIGYDQLQRADDFAVWAIELDDRVIGDVSLHLRRDDGRLMTSKAICVEMGWIIHPDYQGHGYATEAAFCLMDLAFHRIGAAAVLATIDPMNDPSRAVARRLGMAQVAPRVHLRWASDSKETR